MKVETYWIFREFNTHDWCVWSDAEERVVCCCDTKEEAQAVASGRNAIEFEERYCKNCDRYIECEVDGWICDEMVTLQEGYEVMI